MSDAASKLGYGVPKDTSVVVNRTTKQYNFLHNTYGPSDIATCTFPTGTEYIDTRRSFLTFELLNTKEPKFDTPPTVERFLFGVHGSACNIIKQICIFARSGEELCRIEDFNLLSNMLLPLTYERDWFNRQAAGMWYGDRLYAHKQTCCIPMYILSPLFGYGRLLPAALVSGMRVEITLEIADRVCFGAVILDDPPIPRVTTPVDGFDYSITELSFHLEVVKLADSIRIAMDEIIATRGVELVYSGWHHMYTDPGHDLQGGIELTISDSYARALRAFARVRAIRSGMYADGMRDSFRGEHIFPIAEYQWRLGDRYYPDKPVVNSGRPIMVTYMHALNAMNQWDSRRKQSLLPLLHDDTMSTITTEVMEGTYEAGYGDSYLGFVPGFVGQLGSFARDSHVVGVDLTRDSDDGLTGRSINNVEPLTLWLKGNTNVLEYTAFNFILPDPPERTVDMFMQYAKLVRVFSNNVQVEK